MDRYAEIWTRIGGTPRRMGRLLASAREVRFSYDPDYLDAGLPGLSLLLPPAWLGERPYVHRTSEFFRLPPRLTALIPGGGEDNLVRRLHLELLARRPEGLPAPGFDTDWALLMTAGRGGIGHLDVFPDALAARDWYAAHAQPPFPGVHARPGLSGFWRSLRAWIEDEAELPEALVGEVLGPTPSVEGMIPKLLLSIPEAARGRPGWDGRIDPAGIPCVIKLDTGRYPGVLALELEALALHRELGLAVPDAWLCEVDEELPALAVVRFDRDDHGRPLAMESLHALFATGSREVVGTTDLTLAELGEWLGRLGEYAPVAVRPLQREVWDRHVLAILTGNGDLHLQNLALLTDAEGNTRLAPVYDPAPMRAWPRHDLLSALFLDHRRGLAPALIEVGRAFGLRRPEATERLACWLDAVRTWPERIACLEEVPAQTRARLEGLLVELHRRLRRALARRRSG